MATRVATVVVNQDRTGLVSWIGLLNGDDGAAVAIGRHYDKSVQVVGTPGAGLVLKIQGSNDGGVTFSDLNDIAGVVISFSAAGIELIAEDPLLIRPNITGGDGTTDMDVHISYPVKV